MFEIKTYRTENVTSSLVRSSCNMFFSSIKDIDGITPIMVITSLVDYDLKEEILKVYLRRLMLL